MIIVKIKAGLGNQMFQYACGRALALRNNDKLKLDISDWTDNKEKIREYLLPHFNIKADAASPEDLKRLKHPWGQMIGKGIAKLRSILGVTHVAFEPRILALKGDTYLDGYWQSEQYFADYAEQIRADFALREPLSPAAHAKLAQIQSDELSVSLQIRRGDNAHNPSSMQAFGCPGIEYYQAAIRALTTKLTAQTGAPAKIHLYVFSDEIEWARQNLRSEFPITFVTSKDIPLYQEPTLASACRHHIISNSTLGWWGAWLDRNPQKIVVAPKQWALQRAKNYKDLIPEGWIRV